MFKKIRKKDEKLRYDFLPSAIEIIEKPASPLGKIIIYIITFFIIALLIWSYVGKVDQVVVSSGQVVTIDGIQTINTNINGKIININKVEGDKVEKGEEILTIENDGEDTQLEELNKKLNEAKLNKAIYNEIIKNDCVNDSTYYNYNVSEEKIEEYKLEEQIRKQDEISNYNNYINQVNEINSEINDIYTEASNDKEYTESDKKTDEEIIKSFKEQIAKLEEEYEREQSQKKLNYVQKRNELDVSINTLQSEIDSLSSNEDNYSIKSNVSGTIITMNYNTVGSYINQSTPVAEIVPDDAALEIETTIANKDISQIKKGQKVTIKLEAYDYQEYGTLTGKVSYISPSSITTDNSQVVYKVKVSFDKNENKNIKVIPGMTSSIEIKTKKKRIIDIFLNPFKSTIDEAF